MRPDFGTGLLQFVFAANSPELAAALKLTVQAALSQFLGDVIDVRDLRVEAIEAELRVTLAYALRTTGETRSRHVRRGARREPARAAPSDTAEVCGVDGAGRSVRASRRARAASTTSRSIRTESRCACTSSGRCQPHLTAANVVIEGGVRIRDIVVTDVQASTSTTTVIVCLLVTVDKTGDFSTYCVCLVEPEASVADDSYSPPPAATGRATGRAPAVIDPRYACASVLLPHRLRLDAGLRARAVSARAEGAAAGHRLPGPRLRRLPPADPRSARADDAAVARAARARPGNHVGRVVGLCRRPTELPARLRWRPRPSCGRRAGASRSAGMRGWSTTGCTRAATRAPGSPSTSDADLPGLPIGDLAFAAMSESDGRAAVA